MKKTLFCTGAMYLDINFTNYPFIDSLTNKIETVGSNYEVVPGGSALNFARFCARMGLNTIFVGKHGNDTVGNILLDLTKKERITPQFINSSEVTTNLAITYVNTSGENICTSAGNANQSLTKDEILQKLKENLAEIGFVYLGGILKLDAIASAAKEILQICRDNNIKVILDHGRIPSNINSQKLMLIRSLISEVDYYLPSMDEFLAVFAAKNPEEVVSNSKYKFKNLVIKNAHNGAYGLVDGKLVNVKPYSVNLKNTVGAGDSFNAGFIAATIKGYDYLAAIKFANATAALKISTDSLPTEEEVTRLCLSRNLVCIFALRLEIVSN